MFGSGELIVILCVALLLFGGKKLPEFARNLGKGIREFKKAIHETTEDLPEVPSVKLEKKASPESENSDTP
ncbi:MAG: twin-arginine translocase TatA/TatE family subunit [Parachlamydiaceae bacterium]|nr:twin-arginine translocase TatA/TatE family subunit [Parachlamydiaceae bacterium]